VTPTLALEGLYLYLVRHGFALSVRDYLDALAALDGGFGLLDRGGLHWLCRTLWARSEHEISFVDRLFRDLARPSDEEVYAEGGQVSPPEIRPAPEPLAGALSAAANAAPLEFAGASEAGVGLPPIRMPAIDNVAHVFSARSSVAMRSAIIAFRRFRRAQREGPKTELDVEATIREQSRWGRLVAPALVAARHNRARLVLAVDVSPSMIVWQSICRTIAESLDWAQLAQKEVFYFDNVPDPLFESETLRRPVPLRSAMARSPESALLVVSDAGATRGRQDQERVVATQAFVKAARRSWLPIAWLNPMPSARWRGSSAERIARIPGATMLELTDDGLIRAIDYVRGKGSR